MSKSKIFDPVLETMERQQHARLAGVLIVLVTLIGDQLSKWAIMTEVFAAKPADLITWLTTRELYLEPAAVKITSFFNIVTVWNPGISFGMLQNDLPWLPWALLGLTIVCAIGFFIWMLHAKTWSEAIALALIVGGALGNGLDRARFGAVFDFLDVHAFGWHWPAFNVADSALVIGVVVMLYGMMTSNRKDKMVDFEA